MSHVERVGCAVGKNVFFGLKSASGYKKPGLMPGMLHKIHTDTETRHIQTHTDTHMDFDIYIYIYTHTPTSGQMDRHVTLLGIDKQDSAVTQH